MKTTQKGSLMIIVFTLTILFSIYTIYKMVYQMNLEWSSGQVLGLLAMIFCFALIILMFYNLSIIADDKSITFKLGIGIIKKTYLFENIRECHSVSNNPLAGWGIRFLPGATLYNVSGLKAIELTFKDKSRKVRIGTDKPDEWAEFIEKRIQK